MDLTCCVHYILISIHYATPPGLSFWTLRLFSFDLDFDLFTWPQRNPFDHFFFNSLSGLFFFSKV